MNPTFAGKMALMVTGGVLCTFGMSMAFGWEVGMATTGALLFLAGLFDA